MLKLMHRGAGGIHTMSKKASIPVKYQKLLHIKSGRRCALCRELLVDEHNVVIGENAHIYGEKEGSARYDASFPPDFVNSEANLIFLCANCHTKVDKNESSYSVSYLMDIKAKHEAWIIKQTQVASTSYTFAEIEVLAEYLASKTKHNSVEYDYNLLDIKDKIKRNQLSELERQIISYGLVGVKEIEDYFNQHPDQHFGDRVAIAMKELYNALSRDHSKPSDIFIELWDEASGHRYDFEYKAAGLGILTYFFEKCEVFER
jgi:hypothetical protein